MDLQYRLNIIIVIISFAVTKIILKKHVFRSTS